MFKVPPVSRLTDVLTAAGLPILSVSDNGDGTFAVHLTLGSTVAQQVQADAIARTYVDAPKKQRPLPAILLDLQALTPAQQNKLTAICIAYLIQQNPSLANLVSVALAGDQPDT